MLWHKPIFFRTLVDHIIYFIMYGWENTCRHICFIIFGRSGHLLYTVGEDVVGGAKAKVKSLEAKITKLRLWEFRNNVTFYWGMGVKP